MTTTTVAGLVSDAEWIELLKRFDTDLDARVKVLAIDPNALELTLKIKRAREALLACPTTGTLQASQKAVREAEAAVAAADRERDRAFRAWEQARDRHNSTLANRTRAKEAAAALVKPFGDFAGQVGGIGRAGLGVLADELKERGIAVKGDKVQLPV